MKIERSEGDRTVQAVRVYQERQAPHARWDYQRSYEAIARRQENSFDKPEDRARYAQEYEIWLQMLDGRKDELRHCCADTKLAGLIKHTASLYHVACLFAMSSVDLFEAIQLMRWASRLKTLKVRDDLWPTIFQTIYNTERLRSQCFDMREMRLMVRNVVRDLR